MTRHMTMRDIDIYIQEIKTQIEFAKFSYQSFLSAYSLKDTFQVFMHIHHFLIHVSNVEKILDTSKSPFRHQIIGNQITNVDLKPFKRVRNQFEHFDEKLDKWIKNNNGNTFFDMNFIKGTKGFPEKAFLRALDDKVLKFQGESYDLDRLINLMKQIESDINHLQLNAE